MAEMIPFDERDGALWMDGKIVPWRDGKVHVLTHGLHFASCVFEGERIYSGHIYHHDQHIRRLFDSAAILGIKIPYTEEVLAAACYEAAQAQNIVDGYVRPVAFRGAATMPTVAAQQAGVHVAVAVWPWPSYFDPKEKLKGIRLDISDWRRPAPDTAPTKAKCAGLYMICTMSKHAAEAQGYEDALMLDWRGQIAEATGANVFLGIGGELHTPKADCFLDGITRRTVMDLARQRGIKVTERAIMPEELGKADEMFIVGTAAEVTPVGEIGPHNFQVGPIARQMMKDYGALVRGQALAA